MLIYRADRDAAVLAARRARARSFPHRYREIELRPAAGTDASRELAERARRGGAARRRSSELLAERAGGNPFFLEEALQDLIERGALRRRDGGAGTLDATATGRRCRRSCRARCRRGSTGCSPRTREVVSVASAIGRGFGLPLLERLLPREQVVPALSELMRLDLIVEVSRRPAPEYRFRHGLVQEVAYSSLLEPARRSLHRRIGEALEALYGESGDEVYGPLARHFAEADEPERAARYLLAAGDAARAVVRRPRGGRALPARAHVPAAPRRSRARARHALQDRARAPSGVRLRARRAGLRRGLRLLGRRARGARPEPGAGRGRARAARFLRARRHVLDASRRS